MKGGVFGISLVRDGRVRHVIAVGKTGSGKSVQLNDLISQIDPLSHRTVVVDFGNSYGLTMAALSGGECRSFEPDPNGQDTLNCFDSGELPITTLFRQNVVRVVHLMAGHSSDPDTNNIRQSVITRTIRMFQNGWARRWMEQESTRRRELERQLIAVRAFAARTGLKGDLAEIYSAWRHDTPDETGIAEEQVDEQSGVSDRDEQEVLNLAYAMMAPAEVPTLSDYCDWLEAYQNVADRDQEEISKLVTLLEVWRADRGIYGQLFDGVNSINLDARHVHVELGRVQDADDRIRSLVSFILTEKILGSIMRLPRAQRKHVVLEELGALLNIEGAIQLVRNFYERCRKYNAVVLSVIQQISNLPEEVARSVVGNCHIGFFFAQKDVRDVALLQELFELPDNVAEMLRTFKPPSKQTGAPFICYEDMGDRTRITPATNIANQEILYVANSSPELFEKRQRDLAQYEDLVEGIKLEALKMDEAAQ